MRQRMLMFSGLCLLLLVLPAAYADGQDLIIIINEPPEATCPGDDSLFVCDLSDICLAGFSGSDPDGDLQSVTVFPGTLSGDTVCFTPVAGMNTITLIATDSHLEADTCQTNIYVTLNSPPVATCPGDETRFVCDLSDICLAGFSGSDPDGNLQSVTVWPPGTLSGDTVCFTPVVGVNTITLVATDSCGAADTCQTNITVRKCDGTAILQPYPLHVTYADYTGPITWYDPIIYHDSVTSGPMNCHIYVGNIPGHLPSQLVEATIVINDSIIPESVVILDGTVPIFPGQEVLRLDYKVRDLILSYDGPVFDTVMVTFTISGLFDDGQPFLACDSLPLIGRTSNCPPTASCPGDDSLFVSDLSDICLTGFCCSDPDDNLQCVEVTGGTLCGGDTVCFTPMGGVNTITLTATDSCGATAACQTSIVVIPPDFDLDGKTNVADLTLLVAYLFTGGDPPVILEAADLDRDGQVTVADLSRLVEILFM